MCLKVPAHATQDCHHFAFVSDDWPQHAGTLYYIINTLADCPHGWWSFVGLFHDPDSLKLSLFHFKDVKVGEQRQEGHTRVSSFRLKTKQDFCFLILLTGSRQRRVPQSSSYHPCENDFAVFQKSYDGSSRDHCGPHVPHVLERWWGCKAISKFQSLPQAHTRFLTTSTQHTRLFQPASSVPIRLPHLLEHIFGDRSSCFNIAIIKEQSLRKSKQIKSKCMWDVAH